MAEVLDRVEGLSGELVLRRSGVVLEVIANGMFLMDTRNGESERLLVSAAVDLARPPVTILIGGLGVGFSLREALDHPAVDSVVVVEREPVVVEWNRTGPLRAVHDGALADPRVRLAEGDLVRWLRHNDDRFGALCLDVDNGPDWTVTEGNGALYDDEGLTLLADHLVPGGVLAVWGAGACAEFTRRLERRFADVRVREVPVPRGEPDVIWLATR